jgi:transcriptional regulator of acetoin/glycerol metabolism
MAGSSGTIDDVTTSEPRRTGRRVEYLVVALECDRPAAGSARYALDRVAEVTVGRGTERGAARREGPAGPTLDVRIAAAAMSTTHARFVRAGGEWIVEDLGSRNGTFVNGARVPRAPLRAGDVITLGRTILLVSAPHVSVVDALPDVDVTAPPDHGGHVALDPELASHLAEVARVARSSIPILVRGETGTGKDVLARSVHAMSGRAGAFVAVNCGGIPATLVESHFFGHVKGAFSGASSNEPGAFRAADGGTLFLDEVGDLSSAAQAALLRALQEREVVPVGGTRPIKVDLRVVAATHKPLETMAARGDFRSDLLARLSGFTALMPPLRARRLDLGLIIAALVRKLANDAAGDVRLTTAAAEALFRYGWPLNTRELEQCLARAIVLAGGEAVDVHHLPVAVAQGERAAPLPSGLRPRDEEIRRELLEQLARYKGNLASVARAMGKARMQVHRWCQRFGIDPNLYRG